MVVNLRRGCDKVRGGSVRGPGAGAPPPVIPVPPLRRRGAAPPTPPPPPPQRQGRHQPARRARAPTPTPTPPPPTPAALPPPPKIRIPPFNEPLAYPLPPNLVTRRNEVDEKNERLSHNYTEIAKYRKEIHADKTVIAVADLVGFDRSVGPLRLEILKLRADCDAIREEVLSLGADPFPEPPAFWTAM